MKKFVILGLIFFVSAAYADDEPDLDYVELMLDSNNYDADKAYVDLVKGKFQNRLLYNAMKILEGMDKNCTRVHNIKNFGNLILEKSFLIYDCLVKFHNSSQSICQTVRAHLGECAKPLRDLVTTCAPQEGKDVPDLLKIITETLIDELCKTQLGQLFEIFHPCQFSKEYTDFEACRSVKSTVDSFPERIFPTKTFICSLMPKVRTCSEQRYGASCSNPYTKNAFIRLHVAIDDATKETCAATNKNDENAV